VKLIAIRLAGEGALPRWSPALLRLLLLAQYVLFGATIGLQSMIWGDVQHALRLGEGPFGTVMVVTPMVGFVLLLTASRSWRRFGQRRVATAGLLTIGGALLALGSAHTVAMLLVSRVLSGLGFALLESAANNGALDWEQATGRRVVGTLYAFFSVGMVAGALGGGLLLQAGVGYRAALLLLAPCMLLAAAFTALTAYPPERAGGGPAGGVSGAILRRRGFLTLAAISLLGVAGEALVDLWAVIYLRGLGANALAGSVAFALFSGAMVAGRLANPALITRWGARAAIRFTAASAAGAALLLALGGALPSVAAFALLALGVAGVLPTMLSAARERFTAEGEAPVNAIVATTYLGFVVGPPAIGWLAELCGLQPAMLIFLGLIAAAMYGLSREL
jgi:MFS family permease